MKKRIRFNNLVVTAAELPKIELIVKRLSNLSPSDAFVSVDFKKGPEGYHGQIQVTSSMQNFSEISFNKDLVPLMEELSNLIMGHITIWRKNRFEPTLSPLDKVVS